jgi:hypothetical protein
VICGDSDTPAVVNLNHYGGIFSGWQFTSTDGRYCPSSSGADWTLAGVAGGGSGAVTLTSVTPGSSPCPVVCPEPLTFTATGDYAGCGLELTLSFSMDTAGDPSSWTAAGNMDSTITDEGTYWQINFYDPAGCSECSWFWTASKEDHPDCPPSSPGDWTYSGNTEDLPLNVCGDAVLS